MSVANAIRTGTPWPEDSRRAHDSTLGCIDSRRVERILPKLIQHSELLLEGNASFPGDVAQLFNDRQDQRDAIFAAPFLCFALRVAGQEGPGGAGGGLGGAKDANVVVNLALEGIALNEALNFHAPQDMPDALPHPPLPNFLAP